MALHMQLVNTIGRYLASLEDEIARLRAAGACLTGEDPARTRRADTRPSTGDSRSARRSREPRHETPVRAALERSRTSQQAFSVMTGSGLPLPDLTVIRPPTQPRIPADARRGLEADVLAVLEPAFARLLTSSAGHPTAADATARARPTARAHARKRALAPNATGCKQRVERAPGGDYTQLCRSLHVRTLSLR